MTRMSISEACTYCVLTWDACDSTVIIYLTIISPLSPSPSPSPSLHLINTLSMLHCTVWLTPCSCLLWRSVWQFGGSSPSKTEERMSNYWVSIVLTSLHTVWLIPYVWLLLLILMYLCLSIMQALYIPHTHTHTTSKKGRFLYRASSNLCFIFVTLYSNTPSACDSHMTYGACRG